MFQVLKNPTFKHAVKVKVPVDGGFKDQTFKAEFRVMTDDEMAAHRLDSIEAMKAYIRDFLVGLEGVFDDQKPPQQIPYNSDLREQLIGLPFVRRALIDTYVAALTGETRGN